VNRCPNFPEGKPRLRHFSRGIEPVCPLPFPLCKKKSGDEFDSRGAFPRGVTGRFPHAIADAATLGLHASGSRLTETFPSRCYAHSRTRLVRLFHHDLAVATGCSRPTVFTGPPLLTGDPDLLRSWLAFTNAGGLALGCVSGGFGRPRPDIPFTCAQAFVRA